LAEKDTGLFLSDTRYVSKLEILANGNPPVFRSRRELRNGYAAWTELAIAAPNRVEHNDLKDSTVSVLRRQILDDSSLTDSLCFENRGPETFRLSVVLNVAADFVDLFELLGHPRRRFGCHHTPQINGTQLTFAYTGVDAKIRKTCFRFGQVPQTINPGSASWSIALEGSHSVTLGWTVKFGEDTRTVLGELMTTG
jgi:glycogen debranching enzyme